MNTINTDKEIYANRKPITTSKITDFLYADLTYKVRGALFAVYNELGFGHKEQVYQKALNNELESLGIPFKREVNLKVTYKGVAVGNYRPDFVIDEKIVLELKAVDFLSKIYEQQILNYLKSTGYSLGLLVNFGGTKLYIKRLIWSRNPQNNPRKLYSTNQRKSVKEINQ